MEAAQFFDKFAAFALRYEMDFIRRAFCTLPKHIIDHLEIKFMDCYSKHGSYGAMVAFWSELSGNNRELLALHIELNHKP